MASHSPKRGPATLSGKSNQPRPPPEHPNRAWNALPLLGVVLQHPEEAVAGAGCAAFGPTGRIPCIPRTRPGKVAGPGAARRMRPFRVEHEPGLRSSAPATRRWALVLNVSVSILADAVQVARGADEDLPV